MFPHMAHVMHVMCSTHTCIDQFLSLHSPVFQPHDILGHMICVCSIKIHSSRILPKKLVQVKMPQRDSLDLQTFCTFCTTESSLSSQTLVQWGRFLLLKRGAGPPNWCPVRPKMPGEDGCFGTPLGGLFEAVDMRSLQNRNLALKRKTKTQTKIVAPGGANDHPAIGTWRKEKDFSKKPKKSRRIVTTCTC